MLDGDGDVLRDQPGALCAPGRDPLISGKRIAGI
jgi:hypothetical protein